MLTLALGRIDERSKFPAYFLKFELSPIENAANCLDGGIRLSLYGYTRFAVAWIITHGNCS